MAHHADDKSTASTGLSLRAVFLIAVVLGLLIPASIISYLSFNIQRDALTAQLETDQKRLLDIVALGMQEPLWNLSRQAGNPLIASVMEDARVVSIRVTDTQSNQIFLSSVRAERIGSVSFVEKPVIYRGEEIGQVTLEFDNEHLAIALNNQIKNILMILVAQLVLSILLIMSILHSRFLSPMKALTEQARLLAELKLDRPFEWQRRDEIGHLGKHLEWTRAELKLAGRITRQDPGAGGGYFPPSRGGGRAAPFREQIPRVVLVQPRRHRDQLLGRPGDRRQSGLPQSDVL